MTSTTCSTQANRWLRRPLSRADVVGVYAGLRPLRLRRAERRGHARRSRASTSSRGRRQGSSRSPAASTRPTASWRPTSVDAAVDELPETTAARRRRGPRRSPLVGAEEFAALWDGRHDLTARAPPAPAGRRAPAAASRRPDRRRAGAGGRRTVAGRARRARCALPGGRDRHAAAAEGALDVVDVLHRRTRLHVETKNGGREGADTVAALLAGPLAAGRRRRPRSEPPRTGRCRWPGRTDLVARGTPRADRGGPTALAGRLPASRLQSCRFHRP